MAKTIKNKVILMFGPPGAGKDTQAERLAKRFNLFHFITSSFIQQIIFNPRLQKNPIIRKQLKLYQSGIWCGPAWVLTLVKKKVKEISKRGRGMVFTASPRTLFEARGLIPFLESLYGQENIYVLKIVLKDKSAIFRIIHRRFCEKCKHTIIYSPINKSLKKCPKCGGKIISRKIDTAVITRKRLKEYKKRTMPVLRFLKKRHYKIIEIGGEPLPGAVTKQIFEKLEKADF